MLLIFLTCLAAMPMLLFLLNRTLTPLHDSQEPPLIPCHPPIFGHIIGMLRHGSRYYDQIARKYPALPIYTLGMPRGKTYVVTGPELVQAVDRQPNAFSFNPIVLQFARRFFDASPESMEILAAYTPGRQAQGLNPEILRSQHETLAPGKSLTVMTKEMLRGILRFLESEDKRLRNGLQVGLFDFFQSFMTAVSTDAVYGAQHNPYQDPAVTKGLWEIYRDFGRLGLNVRPDIIAPKAYSARKVIFNAMHRYYANGGHKFASKLIQARYDIHVKYNISQGDIDHFDLGISFGLLANSSPAMFWVIYYAFSEPRYLSEIRNAVLGVPGVEQQSSISEVENTRSTRTETPTVTINVAEVMGRCPLLSSFVQEVLRVQSTSASARVVMQDTVLDGQYLLKKDNFILSPSVVMHKNEQSWGSNAGSFDPYRFVQQESTPEMQGSSRRQHRVPSSANRSWGGGVNHCPGRYFAMNELVSILVIMALKYEIRPASGAWAFPKTAGHISGSIMQPLDDIHTFVTERQNVPRWDFIWEP